MTDDLRDILSAIYLARVAQQDTEPCSPGWLALTRIIGHLFVRLTEQ